MRICPYGKLVKLVKVSDSRGVSWWAKSDVVREADPHPVFSLTGHTRGHALTVPVL